MKLAPGPACHTGVKPPELRPSVQTAEVPRHHVEIDGATPGVFEFDGASADGRVLFEYISRHDYTAWGRGTLGWSSVFDYDFSMMAMLFTANLKKAASKEQTYVGVFFDPLGGRTSLGLDDWLEKTGNVGVLSEASMNKDVETKRRLLQQYYAARRSADENSDGTGLGRLSKQVDEFIRYLRQQGVVPRETAED